MDEVAITWNGQTKRWKRYTPLIEVMEGCNNRTMAARYNNCYSSLLAPLDISGEIKPILIDSYEGMRIYRRSLSFILEMAAWEVFPKGRLTLSNSLGKSFYYSIEGEPLRKGDLQKLKAKMNELIAKDIPIYPEVISWEECREYYKKRSPEALQRLLSCNPARVCINKAGDYITLYDGPLIPSTSKAVVFDLMTYQEGLLLRYPSSANPDSLGPFNDEPLLYSVYSEYKSWGKILNIDTVGKLNAQIPDKQKIQHLIEVSESLHNKKIANIGDEVAKRQGKVKIVLIAGPSSSGKTTFTKKLCTQLRVVGFDPVMVSLDDYYLPKEEVPVDEKGEPDLEALEALDIPLLNKNLSSLLKGEETEIPVFNFKKGGRQEKGHILKMEENSLLVMEGIHGLNPKLVPDIPQESIFKVYISALTQLNLDNHTRIPTTDNRLIRRMVRDHQFRNYSAAATFHIWPSVRRGEGENIFPNQGNADAVFNSALDYELAALKPYVEPLLKGISPDQWEYAEAQRLLTFLENFSPIPESFVPANSILREFIGGSSFKY